MTIRRISQICCERCEHASELARTTNAGRDIKPTGWARVQVTVKVEPNKPVQVIKTIDLCPPCVKALTGFIDQQEAGA